MRQMIRVGLVAFVVSIGLASASHVVRAAPEAPGVDPLRVANAGGMRCMRVEIRLPDTIVFFGAAGDELRAQVSTNLSAGNYTLRYAADERQFSVSPWPDKNAIVHVSLPGRKKATGRRYQSCLASMKRGVPLVVVGASSSKRANAGAGTAASARAPGNGTSGAASGAGAESDVAMTEMSADQVRAVLDAAGGQSYDQTWADVSRDLAIDTRPLSAAGMRETIDAHTGRLGIANAPATSTAEVIEDLKAKSEAWHALKDWERQLWRDFSEQYGESSYPGDLASADELALTPDTRLSMALRIAPRYMSEGARDAARALFNDPVFATTIVVGVSAYLALWLAPEPIFTKATAVLTTVGLVASAGFTASEIVALARAWDRLESDTRHAQSLGAIERAAERFGKSVGGSGVRLLLALATAVGAKVAKAGAAGGPAAGSTSAPVIVGQSGGAAVAAAPTMGGVSVKVTADGAVVLVNGSMTMYAVAHGPGGGTGTGGGSAKDAGPGEWQPVNESMSGRARTYQEQITGRSADQSYVVRGVRFDGYKNGKLLDAKGKGYDHFIKEGEFLKWFKKKGRTKLLDQAKRQIDAAGGVPIEWHVAQEEPAQVIRKLFKKEDVTKIEIIHTPMK